uniref:Uncharacterized protein n=1 Tax=Fagus sylvatica TaxID=28930 RepID=A0A2N9EUA7_FAGSY
MPRRRAVQSRPLSSTEAMFKMVMDAGENAKNKSPVTTPKIQKIQTFAFLLRESKGFRKYYEPRAVSLGPIHHGKPKYQLAEKYKLILASEFIKDSGKVIDELYKIIADNIKELRECYEQKLSVKKKVLKESIKLFIKRLSHQRLERQQAESKKGEKEIPHEQRLSMDREQEPIHLLHLLRTSLLGNPQQVDNSTGQKYFNLMAFEMCPDFDNNFEITSYICFLNSLMNHAYHVLELRKVGNTPQLPWQRPSSG